MEPALLLRHADVQRAHVDEAEARPPPCAEFSVSDATSLRRPVQELAASASSVLLAQAEEVPTFLQYAKEPVD